MLQFDAHVVTNRYLTNEKTEVHVVRCDADSAGCGTEKMGAGGSGQRGLREQTHPAPSTHHTTSTSAGQQSGEQTRLLSGSAIENSFGSASGAPVLQHR
jgi:hypothetical protein